MIKRIANALLNFLAKHGNIVPEHREVYLYGLDLLLYTLLSTIGLIGLGFLCGKPLESILIILLYYVNQTLGGGFHASTHLKCFITMVLGLLGCLATFLLPFDQWVYCVLGVVGLVLMMKHPLVLHKNKEYLQTKQDIFCKRSRAALLVQGICLMAIALWGESIYLQAFCVALGVCAISRLVGVFQKTKGHNAQYNE